MQESVLELLATGPLLLLLDNCEHVLDTIAAFVERLKNPNAAAPVTTPEPALAEETTEAKPEVTAEESKPAFSRV